MGQSNHSYARPQDPHQAVGFAGSGSVSDLNNGNTTNPNATGPGNEIALASFTPHAGGIYRVDYSSDEIFGGATASSGMTIRQVGGVDIYVTAPATGDADGARLSTSRLSNFVEVTLEEGVEYEVLRWAGGGSYAVGNIACIAAIGIAEYVAKLTTDDRKIDALNPEFYKAAGSVLSNGSTEQIAGGSVTRIGIGQYDINFNSPATSATYPVLATMQALAQNDDYQWAYLNRTVDGFRIEIREQDNGPAAGVLRDSGFSFFVPLI